MLWWRFSLPKNIYETDLEEVSSLGPKTPRNRLLQLLNERILRRKRKRAIKEPNATDPNPDIAQHQHGHLHALNSTPQDPNTTHPIEIDFQIYSNSQLEKMLHDVGVDTFGMHKVKLIENCKIYQDLSTYFSILLLVSLYLIPPKCWKMIRIWSVIPPFTFSEKSKNQVDRKFF